MISTCMCTCYVHSVTNIHVWGKHRLFNLSLTLCIHLYSHNYHKACRVHWCMDWVHTSLHAPPPPSDATAIHSHTHHVHSKTDTKMLMTATIILVWYICDPPWQNQPYCAHNRFWVKVTITNYNLWTTAPPNLKSLAHVVMEIWAKIHSDRPY